MDTLAVVAVVALTVGAVVVVYEVATRRRMLKRSRLSPHITFGAGVRGTSHRFHRPSVEGCRCVDPATPARSGMTPPTDEPLHTRAAEVAAESYRHTA